MRIQSTLFALAAVFAAGFAAHADDSPVLRIQMGNTIFLDGGGNQGPGTPGGPDIPTGPKELLITATTGSWRSNDAIGFPVSIAGGDGNYSVTSNTPGISYASGSVIGYLPPGVAPSYVSPVSLHAVDGHGVEGVGNFDVAVYPELRVQVQAKILGYPGEALVYDPVKFGLVGTQSWSIGAAQARLDAIGLAFSTSTGKISGTPSKVGTVNGATLLLTDAVDGRTASSLPFDIEIVDRSYEAVMADTYTNFDAALAFTETAWLSDKPKVLKVKTGALFRSTTSTAALYVGKAFGGTLTIIVDGDIHGMPGLGGNGTAGGNGGPAIDARGMNIAIVNNNAIRGGGGGGGGGGKGGDGRTEAPNPTGWSALQNASSPETRCYYERADQLQRVTASWGGVVVYSTVRSPSSSIPSFVNGGYQYECEGTGTSANNYYYKGIKRTPIVAQNYSGSGGGVGGTGQGSTNAQASPGADGSSIFDGAKGAARGGAGGAGGAWGADGKAGAKGAQGQFSAGADGLAGGKAGAAILNAGNVTLTGAGTLSGVVAR